MTVLTFGSRIPLLTFETGYLLNAEHELRIPKEIGRSPETTQATLAAQLGVAIGSINFAVKRLVNQGYAHVKLRRRLKYIITPKGLTLRSKLAVEV